MKNLFYLFLAAFLFMWSCTQKKENAPLTFDTITIQEKVLLVPESKDTIPYAELNLEFVYPKTFRDNKHKLKNLQKVFQKYILGEDYTNAPTPQKAIENYKENYIESYRDEVKQIYLSELKNTSKENMYKYIYSYEEDIQSAVLFANDSLISISNYIYSYTGGAHGMHSTLLKSIDLKTVKPIKLQSIFQSGYEQSLAEIIQSKLLENIKKDGKDENYFFDFGSIMPNENFCLTDTSLQFIYGVYEIAPYAAGQFDVEIKYEEIKELLNMEVINKYIYHNTKKK